MTRDKRLIATSPLGREGFFMIEAIQIGPAAFGPTAQNSGGGCGFICGLGLGVAERMGIEQVIKTQAVDLATAESELVNLDPIGVYNLKAKRVKFDDKVTGLTRDEWTLVSPDFNNEPIGKWTDAGEHCTGTQKEYTRIINWANELAETEGEANLVWVSPGEKQIENNHMPEHRAYVLRKNADGTVLASAYQLTGSKDSLARMMKRLGYENTGKQESLEDQHILQEGKANVITHSDVYNAYTVSLSADERVRSKQFLQRFQKDTVTISDKERLEKIHKSSQKYEAKLKENYKGDIEKALESIAQGFAAIPKLDGGWDNVLISERSQRDFADYNYLDKHGQNTKDMETSQISQIIEPIVPAVMAFAQMIVGQKDNDESFDVSLPEVLVKEKEALSLKTETYDLQQFDDLSELVVTIFTPKKEPDIDTSSPILSFLDILIASIPVVHADAVYEPPDSESLERHTNIKTEFQQGLEETAVRLEGEIPRSLHLMYFEKENNKQIRKEADVVRLGEEILEMIADSENLSLTQYKDKKQRHKTEKLGILLFLVNVYEDPNSSEEIKHILAALIYQQIETMREDENLIRRYPKLAGIFDKFSLVVPQLDFLKERFNILLLLLQKYYFTHEKLENIGTTDVLQIAMMVYQLGLFVKMQNHIIGRGAIYFSFENLPNIGHLKLKNIILAKNKNKKKTKRKGAGTIYFSRTKIIYQYLSQTVDV